MATKSSKKQLEQWEKQTTRHMAVLRRGTTDWREQQWPRYSDERRAAAAGGRPAPPSVRSFPKDGKYSTWLRGHVPMGEEAERLLAGFLTEAARSSGLLDAPPCPVRQLLPFQAWRVRLPWAMLHPTNVAATSLPEVPTRIICGDDAFDFDGFQLLVHGGQAAEVLSTLAPTLRHRVVRYGREWELTLERDGEELQQWEVSAMDWLSRRIFDELLGLPLATWLPGVASSADSGSGAADSGSSGSAECCRAFHLVPRFVGSRSGHLLWAHDICAYLNQADRPLDDVLRAAAAAAAASGNAPDVLAALRGEAVWTGGFALRADDARVTADGSGVELLHWPLLPGWFVKSGVGSGGGAGAVRGSLAPPPEAGLRDGEPLRVLSTGVRATGLRADVLAAAAAMPGLVQTIVAAASTLDVQQALGVRFHDVTLLTTALMHPSYVELHAPLDRRARLAFSRTAPSPWSPRRGRLAEAMSWLEVEEITQNQRLEFLGDAVLELLISVGLHASLPQSAEGQLTEYRACVAANQHLAWLASRVHIGDRVWRAPFADLYLPHEPAYRLMMADALESTFGALYIDQGLPACAEMLARLLFPPTPSPSPSTPSTPSTTPSSAAAEQSPAGSVLAAMASAAGDTEVLRAAWLRPASERSWTADGDRDACLAKWPDLAKQVELEERLGVRFARPRLLTEALTHPSFSRDPNVKHVMGVPTQSRLEFLGDAVVQLLGTHLWLSEWPELDEGRLTILRSATVKNAALHRAAQNIGLLPFVRYLAADQHGDGVLQPPINLLADSMEALAAALFLEAGLDAVAVFLNHCMLLPRSRRLVLERAAELNLLDPVPRLVDFALRERLHVQYRLLRRSDCAGGFGRCFHVAAILSPEPTHRDGVAELPPILETDGRALSFAGAQRLAARRALDMLLPLEQQHPSAPGESGGGGGGGRSQYTLPPPPRWQPPRPS